MTETCIHGNGLYRCGICNRNEEFIGGLQTRIATLERALKTAQETLERIAWGTTIPSADAMTDAELAREALKKIESVLK